MKVKLVLLSILILNTSIIQQKPEIIILGKWILKKHLAKWDNKTVDCIQLSKQSTSIEFLSGGSYCLTKSDKKNGSVMMKGKWSITNNGNEIIFFDSYLVPESKHVNIGNITCKIIKLTSTDFVIKEFICIEGVGEEDKGISYYKKE